MIIINKLMIIILHSDTFFKEIQDNISIMYDNSEHDNNDNNVNNNHQM